MCWFGAGMGSSSSSSRRRAPRHACVCPPPFPPSHAHTARAGLSHELLLLLDLLLLLVLFFGRGGGEDKKRSSQAERRSRLVFQHRRHGAQQRSSAARRQRIFCPTSSVSLSLTAARLCSLASFRLSASELDLLRSCSSYSGRWWLLCRRGREEGEREGDRYLRERANNGKDPPLLCIVRPPPLIHRCPLPLRTCISPRSAVYTQL